MIDRFNELAASMGVPRRILIGEPDASLASTAECEHHFRKLTEWRDALMSSLLPIQHRIMEQHFPELYWEPFFLCSPRGRVWIRRKTPIKMEVTW